MAGQYIRLSLGADSPVEFSAELIAPITSTIGGALWPNFFVRVAAHDHSLQSWGLRPRSYAKTGLRPASVLSWSCSFGLGLRRIGLLLVLLPTCVAR